MNPGRDHELLRARSYDDVAEAYERVNAPLMFDAPARGLVECGGVSAGERVLDVGAGTGAVTRAAMAAAGSPERVVAVDPSLPMLMAARRASVQHTVAAALPRLPFAGDAFDVILSGFVITHLDDPDAAAREFHRVVRPGGRVAMSSWSVAEDDYSRTWVTTVHEFGDPELLAAAAQRVLPGEARFSQPDGLSRLLAANGFGIVRSETRTFEFALTLEEMITTREACASGRALRALLSEPAWRKFQSRIRDVLGKKFPEGIRYRREVHFAVGRKA